MGFLVLIILTGVVIAIVASSSSGNKTYSGYQGGYVRDYDSYYAQVADDAMMGDESAMEEMRSEFGEGEW